MKNRVLSLLLTLSMVLTMVPMAFAAEYTDTEGHWAEAAIDRWSELGIVEGINGLFDPNGQLTRAQLAAIIARLLNLPAAEAAGFGDTEGHWAEDVINRCAAAGIMQGDGVSARPDDTVSREETMVMLGRALGIQPVENADLSSYGDESAVSDWAAGYVAALTEAGIVNGVDGNLNPDAEIDRAATMTILDRAITTYVTEPGTTIEANGGIIVVAAEDVTITGKADGVVITEAAAEGTTKLENADVGTVTVQAADTSVVLGENSTADNVEMTKQAAGTEVEVAKGAAVGTVTTAAPESTVSVSGTVGTVETTETAANTKVEAAAGSTVTNVDNKADGTTVSGAGKVENVTTSGDNTTVNTNGTKVEATEGTTGTTAGNKPVTGGSTSTTTPSAPVHTCVVVKTEVTAPTCTEKGYTTYTTCCGYSYTSNETEKYVHQDGVECPTCKLTEVSTAAGLANAFANGGSNVKLLADIELAETATVAEGKTVVLDLNGKSITMEEDKISTTYAISNLGALTIKDSVGAGSVSSRGIYNGYNPDGNVTVTTAKLTVESGTFNAKGTNGGAAIFNYGIVDIKGGKFTSNGGYGLNNQAGATLSVENAEVKGGIYNMGDLTINSGSVYQHISGRHAVYNWEATALINGGEFDSISGNELILADGANSSVTINGGTFDKTAKSWLFGAATGKNITFTINGGTFNGYVNLPEGTVDTIRPYGDPIVVKGGTFNFDPTSWKAEGCDVKANTDAGTWTVVCNYALAEDGTSYMVYTADGLIDRLEANCDVILANDIKIDPATMSNAYGTTGISIKNGQTIDGGGYTLNIKGAGGTWDSGINTTGGTIKNIKVTGSFRGIFINHNSEHSEEVILENVIIEGTTYTISCDQGTYQTLTATNCTFNGWTSYAATIGEVEFINCSFGEGNGYAYCRPYADTTFTDCKFTEGYAVDARQAADTFVDCYVGETLITAENITELLGSNAANATVSNTAN